MLDQFLGEIRMFGGNFPPRGWALCNGQIMSISQNAALFSLLGTTYGGDGINTFALPNMQGRSPVHFGTGAGLPPVTLGEMYGQPSVTLTPNQMPAHNHTVGPVTGTINVFNAPGTVRTPGGNLIAGDSSGNSDFEPDTGGTTGALSALSFTGQIPPVSGAAGGSQPFPTQSPALVVTFLIATTGVFPSR